MEGTRAPTTLVGLVMVLTACGDFGAASDIGTGAYYPPGAGPATGVGATPGGAVDFAFVREQIALGQVPAAQSIRTEGLLSEHDLPVDGPPCDSLLCARPSIAVAPSFETGDNAVWVHVGFASGATAVGEDRRPPLDLVVVVDESGSMAGDIEQTWASVLNIASHLGPDDQLTILGFADDVRVLRSTATVTSHEEVVAQVADIRAAGGWNLDPAMERAFSIARTTRREGALSRVILYTCGYPTVSGAFASETRAGASEGIATTVVGVLLGYDAALADYLGGLRGGSLFYTSSLEDIEGFLAEDFDYLMVPLAYDFRLSMQTGASFELERAYGLPASASGEPADGIEVATLFASKRRGAIALRLTDAEIPSAMESLVSSIQLSYEPATGDAPVVDSADLYFPETTAEDGTHFDGTGSRKLVALVNIAEGMARACLQYHEGARGAATETLDHLIAFVEPEIAALEDEPMTRELELLRRLRENMR